MSGRTSLGDLIRSRRAALGLTQARLAELVGRSPSTIRGWEHDRSVPADEPSLAALVAVLGLTDQEVQDAFGDQEVSHEVAPSAAIPMVDAPLDEPLDEPLRAHLPPMRSAAFLRRTEESEPSVDSSEVTDAAAGVDGLAPEPGLRSQSQPLVDRPDHSEATDPVAGVDGLAPEPGPRPPSQPLVDRADRPDFVGSTYRMSRPQPVADPLPRQQIPGDSGIGSRPTLPRGTSDSAATAVAPTSGRTVSAVSFQPRAPSYLDDPEELRTYRVRTVLTVVLLVLMLIVLMWAFGEAREAFGSLFDEPALPVGRAG